jgi:hypothetical protein
MDAFDCTGWNYTARSFSMNKTFYTRLFSISVSFKTFSLFSSLYATPKFYHFPLLNFLLPHRDLLIELPAVSLPAIFIRRHRARTSEISTLFLMKPQLWGVLSASTTREPPAFIPPIPFDVSDRIN